MLLPLEIRSFAKSSAVAFAGLRISSYFGEPAEGSLPESALQFDCGPVGEFDLLDHYLASGLTLRVKVDG